MTKAEYNKYLKKQEKEELDSKKHLYYERVNAIIDFANRSKGSLIVKSQAKNLDELVQKLFDRTVNSIQKVKDYYQYIKNVPDYVLDKDEDGFYSRMGLAIIDEAVLNVEYKFVYTSDGGMVQRSFTIPMNEENITELIHQLENKLSLDALAKEQRAMMTTKLREYIKKRDNYTNRSKGAKIIFEL